MPVARAVRKGLGTEERSGLGGGATAPWGRRGDRPITPHCSEQGSLSPYGDGIKGDRGLCSDFLGA